MQNQFSIVAISDTHASSSQLEYLIENSIKGDFFIHAGDFTRYGREEHFINFINCLRLLQFRHKIVIAGNHEVSMDKLMPLDRKNKRIEKYPCSLTRQTIVEKIKAEAYYLENDLVEIEGLRIFGSPYSVKYGNGAFQYRKEEDDQVWDHLPEKIDILVTHSPPFGILDATAKGVSAGSKGLLKLVHRIRPKLHIFGHIHEGHGERTEFGVKFMNVAKKFEHITFN